MKFGVFIGVCAVYRKVKALNSCRVFNRIMHENKEIEDILKSGLYSGMVKNERPLSIFLVASAGSGKTSLLNQFNSTSIWNTSDLSQKTLCEKLKTRDNQKLKFSHIVMGDFIAVQSHNYGTVNSVMGMLNRLIFEGIYKEDFYGQTLDLKQRAIIGLITSTTIDKFDDLFTRYSDIGFFDRVIPVFYKLSQRNIKQVSARMKEEIKDFSEIRIKMKGNKISVKIPLGEIADTIEMYSSKVTELQKKFRVERYSNSGKKYYTTNDSNGIRMHGMLRVMAKSIAVMHRGMNVKEVNSTDISKLQDIYRFIGLRSREDIAEI